MTGLARNIDGRAQGHANAPIAQASYRPGSLIGKECHARNDRIRHSPQSNPIPLKRP